MAATIILNSTPRSSSDTFWRTVTAVSAVEAEHYSTLDAMIASADAVVLGEIVAMKEGRTFGDPFGDGSIFVEAELRVDEILSGQVDGSQAIRLEVYVPGPDSLEDTLVLPVPSAGLFVLRNKGVEAARLGYAEDYQAAEAPYFRLITFGGFIASDGGIARISAAADDYLGDLHGDAFNDVVAGVRRGLEQ